MEARRTNIVVRVLVSVSLETQPRSGRSYGFQATGEFDLIDVSSHAPVRQLADIYRY